MAEVISIFEKSQARAKQKLLESECFLDIMTKEIFSFWKSGAISEEEMQELFADLLEWTEARSG